MRHPRQAQIWSVCALALSLLFITGCASTHRLDGGRSAQFADTGGTEVEALRFNLLGSVFQVYPFTLRKSVESTVDEPVAAAGYAAGSALAAESMQAQMTRKAGEKTVTYGATGLEYKAQDLANIFKSFAEIIEQAERFKNNLPRVDSEDSGGVDTDDTTDDEPDGDDTPDES